MSEQLILNLNSKETPLLDNYFYGKNANLKKILTDIFSYDLNSIVLSGKKGSGKKFLLKAMSNKYNSIYIDLSKYSFSFMPIIENDKTIVLINNFDFIQHKYEAAIIKLYNDCIETSSKLIISTQKKDITSLIETKDLLSRVNSSLIFDLDTQESDEVESFIKFYSNLNKVYLEDNVTKYILRHYQRDLVFLKHLIKTIGKVSFSSKRKISINLIKEVFG
jgi:chromosomal replication initiation ATPase DnaA